MFDRTGKWEACKPESGIIFGLCAWQDDRICTGSKHNEILIRDKKIIIGYFTISRKYSSGDGSPSAISDGKLCTVSSDKVIRVWNLQSCKCETALIGHEDIVVAIVEYSPTQICSGIWPLKHARRLYILIHTFPN
jgi:WD40 repeat protein